MATAKPKRAPAWSRPEVLDLIQLWGEESVLLQLRARKRNLDIYGRISQGMLEKGHQRDAQQCRIKIKELRQTYQKARDANSCSGSTPKTFRFYDEVHAILGGDPTTIPPRSIDTSTTSQQSMNNEEESMDEEEGEKEPVQSKEHESEVSLLPETLDLFLTPEQSTSTHDSTNDPGESTSDTSPVARPLSSAADRLSQIRKRKKLNKDDMFLELMNASAAAETEQRAMWLTMSQNIRQMQDHDRSTTQEMLRLLRDQAELLRVIVDRVPMTPSPSRAPNRSRRRLARRQHLLSSTLVEGSRKLQRPR
ncbi:uncharacterized protein [Emydura macquarii macquarii]|uniref:uncharacterized protein n=1 Tax=Emydura macquarii macquarii TaxID=1129001 RepID=UPI00352A9687